MEVKSFIRSFIERDDSWNFVAHIDFLHSSCSYFQLPTYNLEKVLIPQIYAKNKAILKEAPKEQDVKLGHIISAN